MKVKTVPGQNDKWEFGWYLITDRREKKKRRQLSYVLRQKSQMSVKRFKIFLCAFQAFSYFSSFSFLSCSPSFPLCSHSCNIPSFISLLDIPVNTTSKALEMDAEWQCLLLVCRQTDGSKVLDWRPWLSVCQDLKPFFYSPLLSDLKPLTFLLFLLLSTSTFALW